MPAPKLLLRVAVGSIAVSLIVLGLKALAYGVTGSVALYSDALESIINIVTAITAFAALRLSEKPADQNHPFGHHKAEYLSAVLAGVLIVLASISILREAYGAFSHPRRLDAPLPGLLLSLTATAINAAWALLLIRVGGKHRSPALRADGRHILTDVITSVGVLVGLVGALALDMPILDPILAALVALNILWMGFRLMKESVGGLMDEAAPRTALDTIQSIIARESEGAIEVHDLRTRQAGRATFIQFHLVVGGDMSVSRAHELCDRLEQALREAVEGAIVTIHVEPANKAKHQGIRVR